MTIIVAVKLGQPAICAMVGRSNNTTLTSIRLPSANLRVVRRDPALTITLRRRKGSSTLILSHGPLSMCQRIE